MKELTPEQIQQQLIKSQANRNDILTSPLNAEEKKERISYFFHSFVCFIWESKSRWILLAVASFCPW